MKNKYEKALQTLIMGLGFRSNEDKYFEALGLFRELIDKDNQGTLYLCGYCGEYTYRRYNKTYDVGCPRCGKEGTLNEI